MLSFLSQNKKFVCNSDNPPFTNNISVTVNYVNLNLPKSTAGFESNSCSCAQYLVVHEIRD